MPADRRDPPPLLELPPELPPEAAPVTFAEDGKPIEIAGVRISERMAKFLEILKRGKDRGPR